MESLFPLVASETLDVSSESIMTAEVLADEGADNDRRIVEDVEFLGVFEFPSLLEFESTTVGGLSGITYDPESETYFAVSDDRDAGEDGTPRVYEISIDLSDGTLDDGDVALVDVFALTQVDGTTTLDVINPDPEGIALDEMGQFYISSERDLNGDPAIFLFDETFSQIGELTVDDKFLPDGGGTAGVRNNLGFESLTITPDQTTLYTATESALVQDGEVASLETGSAARIIRYDLQTGEPTAEFIYEVDPIAAEPDPVDAFADSGLVELLALDNEGTLLALERSFSVGAEDRGYTGKLYLVRTQGATNVIDFDAVPTEIEDGELEINVDEVATKELLADLSEFDIVVDNVEGLAFGPELADGRQSLIIVSDDNFSAFGPQATQFVALALDLGTVPTVTPVLETPDELRFPVPGDDEEEEIVEMPEAPAEDETPTMEEEAPAEENEEVVEDAPTDETEAVVPEGPDADDPAIWLNPDDPADSVVITALKNGGLRVYDLAGEEIQSISPNGIRYNNVDVLYGVGDPADPRDLAVVSDRANDTLAIFEIGPDGMLTDVTAPDAPETIFGVDDGEATAYGLTTYSSPIDGRDYAFVTQADGARISQLELLDDGDTVTYRIVRELTPPVPEGEDPADFQSEGIVIDRETGIGYVAVEEELGLLSFDAELGGSDDFETVAPIDSAFFSPDLEGVAIYYGENGDGLIVASSQGDSTFAAFDRASGDFVGSFAITGQEQPEDDMSDDEMLTDEVPVEEMPDGEMTTEEMPVEEVALVEDEPAEPVDPVVETDGLEIFSGPLPGFDQGLLVTQDGSNEPAQILPDPEDGEIQNFNTNFKYTDLGDVLEILDTPSNEDFDPRAPAVLQENQTEASLEDDVLQGTDFADVFVFARGDSTPENTDTVSGFGPGDMVDLSAFSFVEVVPGADPMEGRVGVYETGDGVMVFGNTGRSEDFMLEIENVTMETAMAALVL